MPEKVNPQGKGLQQMQRNASDQDVPAKQMAPPPFQLKADPIQLEDGRGPQLTPPAFGLGYQPRPLNLGIPSLQMPSMVPPLTTGLMPPAAGGLGAPFSGSLVPPLIGSSLPPLGGSLVPPLTTSLMPPTAGALGGPLASPLVPPLTTSFMPPARGPIGGPLAGPLVPPLGAGFQPSLTPSLLPGLMGPPMAQDDLAFMRTLRDRSFGIGSGLLSDDALLSMWQVDPLGKPFLDADGIPRTNADGSPMTQWSQLSPAQLEEQARISRLMAERRRFNLGFSGPVTSQGLGASYQWESGRSLSVGVLPTTNDASTAPGGLDGARIGLDLRL
jgi:hypothetical protein